MVLEVVQEEREQVLPGAVAIPDHVDPSSICYPPHRFVFRHDDIWGPSEEALVPRERLFVVGYGNASEDMVDGQWSLLWHMLHLDLLIFKLHPQPWRRCSAMRGILRVVLARYPTTTAPP